MEYRCPKCGDERYVQGNIVNMTVDTRGIWTWIACKCYNCGQDMFEGRLFEFHGRGCVISPEDYKKVLAGDDDTMSKV